MVISNGTSLPTLFTLVQLGSAGIEFEVHSPIAVFVCITAVRIVLTDTHSFNTLKVTALSCFAGVIDVARVAWVHRLWGIASSVLALPTLALMSTANRFASLVVAFERQTGVFGQVDPGIAVLPIVTIVVLFAAGFSADYIISPIRKCKSTLWPQETRISYVLIVVALQLQLSTRRVDCRI